MRIVLFGDGAWAAQSLLRLGEAGHHVVGVVARVQPSDMALHLAARTHNIPILQPSRVHAAESVATIAALRPDLILSISYNQILREPLLALPQHGAINVHAGKLPYYRGRNVINWAIINGEDEIGITVHRMDAGIDTGDILLQHTLPIAWTDTYGDVLGRVIEHIPEMVVEAVTLIAAGAAQFRPQQGIGTYFGGRGTGDEWLDWSDTSRNLYNKIRAITRPGPGARTLLNGQPITIWRSTYNPDWPCAIATPGQVVGRASEGVLVKTGDSTLLIEEVGDASEPPRWPIGTRLGWNVTAQLHALTERIAELERQLAWREKTDGAS